MFVAPVAFSYESARATTAFSYWTRYASLAFLLEATAFSFRSAKRSVAASTESAMGLDFDWVVAIGGSFILVNGCASRVSDAYASTANELMSTQISASGLRGRGGERAGRRVTGSQL